MSYACGELVEVQITHFWYCTHLTDFHVNFMVCFPVIFLAAVGIGLICLLVCESLSRRMPCVFKHSVP